MTRSLIRLKISHEQSSRNASQVTMTDISEIDAHQLFTESAMDFFYGALISNTT